jgi:hypothetical protein
LDTENGISVRKIVYGESKEEIKKSYFNVGYFVYFEGEKFY